jgi:hypothetical protein
VNGVEGNPGLPQVTLTPPHGSRRRSGDTDQWIDPNECASARNVLSLWRANHRILRTCFVNMYEAFSFSFEEHASNAIRLRSVQSCHATSCMYGYMSHLSCWHRRICHKSASIIVLIYCMFIASVFECWSSSGTAQTKRPRHPEPLAERNSDSTMLCATVGCTRVFHDTTALARKNTMPNMERRWCMSIVHLPITVTVSKKS